MSGYASRRCAMAAAAVLAAASVSQDADAASQCIPRKIFATGKPASMTLFAKARARTAWVQKVSAEPRLGTSYAQWLRARDRRLVCRTVDNRFLCLAAAIPCRSVGFLATRSTPIEPVQKPLAQRPRPL